MFGMIEIISEKRKIETCVKTILNSQALCVEIPKLNKRNLRHAGRVLRGMRVVIPDDCNKSEIEKFGMCVISSEGLLCRVAFQLYMSSLREFKLKPMKTALLIRSTYYNEADMKLLFEFCKNARYISLCAANADIAAQNLFEVCGVAVTDNTKNADVIINMYENKFSLHIIINGIEYTLKDVEFSLKYDAIPLSHIKGICMALLQEGKILPSDIIISSIAYNKKILDIQ